MGVDRLRDKTVIITGAGSGLGRSAMELFAAEGANVVGCGRTQARGDETLDLLKDAGHKGMFVRADVSKADDVARVVDETVAAYGRVDVLVNNASILFAPNQAPGNLGTILDLTEQDWDELFAVNIKGVFLFCKEVIPRMIAQGGGTIVNVGSNTGVIGSPVLHGYSAAKGAVAQLTRNLAVAYARAGVRVNCLVAGGFESPIADQFLPVFEPLLNHPEMRYLWNPVGRIATAREVANSLLFLACDESSYIVGAEVHCDGGQSVAPMPSVMPSAL
jgi:NAD(P)-dependent dehydrogenase (short-subunit alcohol dehydrogenase family)